MNCLSWLAMLPKRVGEPKITASAQRMSSAVASATYCASAAWLAQPALAAIASVTSVASAGMQDWSLVSPPGALADAALLADLVTARSPGYRLRRVAPPSLAGGL